MVLRRDQKQQELPLISTSCVSTRSGPGAEVWSIKIYGSNGSKCAYGEIIKSPCVVGHLKPITQFFAPPRFRQQRFVTLTREHDPTWLILNRQGADS